MSSTFASRVRRPGPDAEVPGEAPTRARRLWSVLPVAAGFAVFGTIVWLAYQDASLGPPIGEPPLIKAAAEPIKLPPEQAEQTTLASEQGTIGRLWSDAEQADQPERLLPSPEAPLSPPLLEEPATAAQALEQSAEPPASQPGAEPAPIGAGGEDSDGGVAALSSGGADGSDTSSPQAGTDESLQPLTEDSPPPAADESLQEAEAALDRLLAEVTGLAENTEAPAATAAAPAVDERAVESPRGGETSEPAPTAAAPTVDEDAVEAPPDDEGSEPAPTATAALSSERAVPAVPPQKPASEPPAATTGSSTEVRPASARAGAPPSASQAPAGSTETAALGPAGAPIATPPVVPDGEFRIQLAAVRGEADAQRAWDLFMVDLGPVLRQVEPIFERAETANGVFYRVQIGPFGSQEAAESLCEQLKQRNASCFVIRR